MIVRALLALSLALPAVASAETVFDTHREVSTPGKTMKLYRPITRHDCKVVAEQGGKPSSADAACAKLAARDLPQPTKLAAR